MILDDYHITDNTLAILPAIDLHTEAIVLEGEQTIYVKKTPFKLIKNSCYTDWSTYDGRRQAVIHHTNYTHKTPIPISVTNNMCFFPTHAPTNFHNHWIAYHHITDVKRMRNTPTKTTITFTNNRTILVDISIHIITNQIQRTNECLYLMKHREILTELKSKSTV